MKVYVLVEAFDDGEGFEAPCVLGVFRNLKDAQAEVTVMGSTSDDWQEWESDLWFLAPPAFITPEGDFREYAYWVYGQPVQETPVTECRCGSKQRSHVAMVQAVAARTEPPHWVFPEPRPGWASLTTEIRRSQSCKACGAPAGAYCVTANGQPTGNHASRGCGEALPSRGEHFG